MRDGERSALWAAADSCTTLPWDGETSPPRDCGFVRAGQPVASSHHPVQGARVCLYISSVLLSPASVWENGLFVLWSNPSQESTNKTKNKMQTRANHVPELRATHGLPAQNPRHTPTLSCSLELRASAPNQASASLSASTLAPPRHCRKPA